MAAWFMSAVVIGGAVGQWPLGWWSDHIDRRIVLIVSCSGAAVVGVILWLQATQLGVAGVLALGFCWGALAFPVYSVSVAQANDRADPGTFVMISSGLLLMYGLGAVAGPFLSSGVMTLIGEQALFLFAAAGHLLLGVFISVRLRYEEEPDQDDHHDFSDALTSAMTMSQVYTPGSEDTE